MKCTSASVYLPQQQQRTTTMRMIQMQLQSFPLFPLPQNPMFDPPFPDVIHHMPEAQKRGIAAGGQLKTT
jgi:hypothetical protein